jgi:hypothetical protein
MRENKTKILGEITLALRLFQKDYLFKLIILLARYPIRCAFARTC